MSLNQESLKDRKQKRSGRPSSKGQVIAMPVSQTTRKTWRQKSLSTKDLMKDRRNKILLEQAVVHSPRDPTSGKRVRVGTVTMFFEGYSAPKLTGQRFVTVTAISGKARKHSGMKPGQTWKRKNRSGSYRQADSNYEAEIQHLETIGKFV